MSIYLLADGVVIHQLEHSLEDAHDKVMKHLCDFFNRRIEFAVPGHEGANKAPVSLAATARR
ncbi:MAG: hypothetical protein GXP37_03725 [Chloroflexi bacterium]|nr:hypothetical protein [Chloroflexota bacterium]